ncbi:nucleotidyl transferase AbiEii/AbiGii toxin family protein [Microlunatus elymi]|uniref:Nucleotidyl transferase AbiEii/AbiGii toxin family protein n=1 Tax=Microlunatus elymi TaxID=2596828 RepID=A0A516PXY1_9ACTN|nr:nucleotidyl transferase AbiEii/AbiGii toxin family protein [Microlunatus elymi]QDP96034.1 nucleotidyl transferase AbiEii/AbiGii toxin family protein [Microlunatus elymi]
MIMPEDALPRIVDDLHGLRSPWALVGGLAVCARAQSRPTADVDIAVAVPDDATAKARVDDLISIGYRPRESIVHDQTGRLATVRLLATVAGEDVAVDLFFASSGVEVETVTAAERLEVRPGLKIPVARIGHLIAVKLCWRRSEKRDRDLRALIERANADDLRDARHLITVITGRGYHRGRDLPSALDTWLEAPRANH